MCCYRARQYRWRCCCRRGVAPERISTGGRVVIGSSIAKERLITVGRVVATGCVVLERVSTVGRVEVAGCVGNECVFTAGRVGAASRVGIERPNTIGRVADANCVAKERIRTGGRVVAGAGVAIERSPTTGRVRVTGRVTKQRLETGGRVDGPVVLFKSASSPRAVFWFVKQPSWQTARACGESPKQPSVSAMRMAELLCFWIESADSWFFLSFSSLRWFCDSRVRKGRRT
jgi:hypothetical protein